MTQDRVQYFQFAKSLDLILKEPPWSPAVWTALQPACHTVECEVANKADTRLSNAVFPSHGRHTGSLPRGFPMSSSSRENPKASLVCTHVSRLNPGPEKPPEPSLHIQKIVYLRVFCPYQ